MQYTLKVLNSTVFKPSTQPSDKIPKDQVISIAAGKEFVVSSWRPEKNGHIFLTLGIDQDGKQMTLTPPGGQPKNGWYVFTKHVEVRKDDKQLALNPTANPMPGKYRLYARSSAARDEWGCLAIRMEVQQDSRAIGATLRMLSGAPGVELLYPTKDYSGSFAPCPEGIYRVGMPERGWFGSNLGAVWMSIDPLPAYQVNNRQSIGLHEDANRYQGSPGSAGCICTYNAADIEYLAQMVEKLSITELVVDHGQGFLKARGFTG